MFSPLPPPENKPTRARSPPVSGPLAPHGKTNQMGGERNLYENFKKSEARCSPLKPQINRAWTPFPTMPRFTVGARIPVSLSRPNLGHSLSGSLPSPPPFLSFPSLHFFSPLIHSFTHSLFPCSIYAHLSCSSSALPLALHSQSLSLSLSISLSRLPFPPILQRHQRRS